MRVIGGDFRSRKLKTLPGLATRPTPDRLRETLFNILAPRIREAMFVDAYAGTGAVGIEALSRGARYVVFLERNREAVEVIRENLVSLGVERKAQVVSGPVLLHLHKVEADIVFLDPPYDAAREYTAALERLAENPPSLVIAQHSVHSDLRDAYGALARRRTLRHGDNVLSFYSAP